MADFIVYILQSGYDGSYYVGWTKDIKERLNRHNNGRTKYTKLKIPWELVCMEIFNTKTAAISREKEIKRRKSRKYIEKLIVGYRGVEQPARSRLISRERPDTDLAITK